MSVEGIVNRPVVIARGKLTIQPGDGEIAAPASGATITLWDQILDSPLGPLPGVQRSMHPFSRYQLDLFSSADSGASGLVFSESQDDGANYDTISSQTYLNANGLTSYEVLARGGHPKITYTNSAVVLTGWRFTLIGIIGDRNPGV